MTANRSAIFTTMNVVFWVIFIGLCIKAGVILFSFFVSLFVNADGAKNLYLGLDLSKLYAYGIRHYTAVVSLLLFLAMLKAYIAYIVVMLFLKLDVSKPFTADVSSLISRISHVALGTGVLAILADGYTKWLLKKGFAVPVDWESSEFLFLAGIIFIIAQIFKRGMELQTENDLTV